MKGPPLLVLDAPPSALDAESEAFVRDAPTRLMRGRTTFALAHRRGTIVHADQILVLTKGRIVEAGAHMALMRSGGDDASLVHRQTQGLAVEPAA